MKKFILHILYFPVKPFTGLLSFTTYNNLSHYDYEYFLFDDGCGNGVCYLYRL